MNVMAFTMALWTADVYRADGLEVSALTGTLTGVFRSLVLLFALPVLFLLGLPFWENACAGLRRGQFSTDLLLAGGVAASFVYSAFSVARGYGQVYFEVGCVVLVMVTLGRWLEATGKLKANEALDQLARLMPDRARLVRAGVETEIDRAAITKGDVLRVLAGERIPADGDVHSGRALVDQQLLTGESIPLHREAGDAVLGGTLNLDGDLLIQVTSDGPEGTLNRLIELVRKARLAKGAYERLADRVAAWFVPVVTLIATITFFAHGWRSGWGEGMLRGLSVLLIACPCALGLATPLAVWTALARAARMQVLFQSGEALEQLAAVRAVRFDKTGTITTGEPALAGFVCETPGESDHTLGYALALASGSSHILARALATAHKSVIRDGRFSAIDSRLEPGRGVVATVADDAANRTVFLGSRRLMDEYGLAVGAALSTAAKSAEPAGQSLAWVGWGGAARGLFIFHEQLRESAQTAIAHCRQLGLDISVLTGDHTARGRTLARELGVPVEAGLLPEDKVAAVRQAHDQYGSVAMVGDGVNDAPALAASNVGVALGCGTDLSRESAAVCLLGNDLDRLPWAIEFSRRTLAVIRGNLFWAFGYNSAGVACAAVGWLTPSLAAILMVGSSAFVILNSLRLKDADTETVVKKPAEESPARTPAVAWEVTAS
jgi:heavy metal translocating P-type ATPase